MDIKEEALQIEVELRDINHQLEAGEIPIKKACKQIHKRLDELHEISIYMPRDYQEEQI
jgi:hypothetical protein